MIDKKIEATIKLWRPIFYSKPYYTEEEIWEWVDEIKSLLKEYAMEIIGESEVGDFYPSRVAQMMGMTEDDMRHDTEVRNQLRAEQREKLLTDDKESV